MKKILFYGFLLFLFAENVLADTCDLKDVTNGFCLQGIDIKEDEIKGTDFFAEELIENNEVNKPGSTYYKVSNNNEILYCSNGVLSTKLLTDENEEIDRACLTKEKNKNSLIFSYIYGYNENKKTGEYSYNPNYLSGNQYEDYYITQTAIWNFSPPNDDQLAYWKWFSNYDFKNKTYYGIKDDTITKISNLINDAITAEDAKPSLEITSESKKMNISSDGKYYLSKITISGKYLNKPIIMTVSGVNGAFISFNINDTSGKNVLSLSDGTNSYITSTVYIKVPVSNITNLESVININVQSQTVFNDKSNIIECHPQKFGVYENENGEQEVYDDQQPMIKYNMVYTNLNDSISLNTYKYPVNISKEDSNGKILKNAKLEIKQGNNIISTFDTGTDIKTILLAPGDYTLSEISAPVGYIHGNAKINFTVSDTGSISINNKVVEKIILINNPITIKISKRRKNEQTELSGATLRITDKQGNIVKDMEGNSLEWITSNKLKSFHIAAGIYILEEIKAPNGYELSDKKIEFTVNEDGTVTTEKGFLKKETLLEDNLIVFENTPAPEEVPTGSIIIYIAISIGAIALGIVIFIILKKYKK